MAFVEIEPEYRGTLAALGLAAPGDFLRPEGVILCGHPDRHVAELRLETRPRPLRVFLKREHRVRWRDRLASALAGFGFVSKSYREFKQLRALRRAGVGCPEPLAAGEDAGGRAFLLVREVPDAVDLRAALLGCGAAAWRRRALARRLGTALARLHAAGFDHPDLYAKHVLVSRAADADRAGFHFLDWQRSGGPRRLSWRRRCRGLAALDATLPDALAGPRDRLACLRAYLCWEPEAAAREGPSPALRAIIRSIRLASAALLRRRHVREMRDAPLRPVTQNLIWLDGEALCVTRAFREQIPGAVPHDLRLPTRPQGGDRLERREISLPGSPRATLVRRSLSRPLLWLWTRLRRRALPSPELEQAGTLFRLQRYGVVTARLLAVGQRHVRPWHTESFLLTESPAAALALKDWLARSAGSRRQRWRLLRQAGEALRRTHHAGYALDTDARDSLANFFLIQRLPSGTGVVLGSPELLRKSPSGGTQDLRRLWRVFAPLCTRTDGLRFLLGYLDVPSQLARSASEGSGASLARASGSRRRITRTIRDAARRLARAVVGPTPRTVTP